MKVDEVLKKHGLKYAPSGSSQFRVKQCASCGDTNNHFFINKETGLWDCKKCGDTGNLWTLRRHLEPIDNVTSLAEMMKTESGGRTSSGFVQKSEECDEAHVTQYVEMLMQTSTAISYLLERGLSRESIVQFKIGVKHEMMDSRMVGMLTIPYYRGGEVVNYKFRTLPEFGKHFRQISDAPHPLWNEDAVDQTNPIFVTEGEFDAMM